MEERQSTSLFQHQLIRRRTMKIVIVGGGAIGRLFGYFLVKGKNEITLIDIDQRHWGPCRKRG